MFARFKKIISGNWILVGMLLGILTGVFLNLYVDNPFIRDTVLMDNVFYFGGNLFIRLMKMLVVPLVFCSIVMSLASISDMRKLTTIGGRAIIFYILLAIISLAIGFGVTYIINPGAGMSLAGAGPATDMAANLTISETILNIVPENPISSMTGGEMLPAILFAILIGYLMINMKDEIHVADRILKELNDIMMLMTEIVMKIAPIGIFCMMARTFGTVGFESIISLAKVIGCQIIAVTLLVFIVYPILIFVFTRLNPLRLFKQYFQVMLFAFSSASSNATIPLHLDTLEEMGVSRDISSFTIPLGSSLNQPGTIIMLACGIMFAAQAHGIDLGISTLLILSFIILLTTISTPSVAMAGIFSLNMIFNSMGLPLTVINLLMGVYNIIDMFITLANVAGNGICTIITAFLYRSREGSN